MHVYISQYGSMGENMYVGTKYHLSELMIALSTTVMETVSSPSLLFYNILRITESWMIAHIFEPVQFHKIMWQNRSCSFHEMTVI